MKTKRFALILTVFSLLFFLTLGQNNSIIGNIVASLITGIVSFLLLKLLLLPLIQRPIEKIVSNNINKYKDLIAYEPINHSRKYLINGSGGVGFLCKDKLVFIPHAINLSKKEITLFFCDIESISGYRVWGIFDTGLKVVLKSGRTEKFVIDKASQFYKSLLDTICV